MGVGRLRRGVAARTTRLARAAAAALALAPGLAAALGLGDLQLLSHLNQPLEARIPVLSAGAGELEALNVSLADAAVLERAGITLSETLRGLRFDVVGGADGGYVRVHTRESVREPVIEFVVDVEWPKGRILREYAVLLEAAP